MAESSEATVIGSDSHFRGELEFEKTAKINGKFDGKISGKGELHVSQNAMCKADIDAVSVQVDGTIEGNLQAKETVTMSDSGTIRGDVTAGKMVMADGAKLFGQVSIGPDGKGMVSGPGASGVSTTTTSGGVSSSPGTRSDGKAEAGKK